MSAVTLTFQVSGIEKSHHVAHTKWGKAIFQEHFVHTGRLCILFFYTILVLLEWKCFKNFSLWQIFPDTACDCKILDLTVKCSCR